MDLITRRHTMLKELGGSPSPGSDPWVELFTSINNGTYTTDYALGDLIPLDLGTLGAVNMEIIAFDADDLADGSGKAPVTLLVKENLGRKTKWADSESNSWSNSTYRSYLRNTVFPLLPANVRTAIKEVAKSYKDKDKATQSGTDTIWAPSEREMYGAASAESEGVIYTYFNSNASRIKENLSGTAASYGTRSRSGSYIVEVTPSGGTFKYSGANNNIGVVFGFCVG